MLTETEKSLVTILNKLEMTQQEIIGIMLMLKENATGQNLLLDFLRSKKPENLTPRVILNKVIEIKEN